MKKLMLFALLATGLSLTVNAQQKPPLSPAAAATGKIGDANITINYSSPSVRGRQIWNTDLVPYGKVWRAGANKATIFETDKDIMVEGQKLPAGKYSVYAIAGESDWVIIFNSQTGQWGITSAHETTLDPAKDVIRVHVKPVKVPDMQEAMSYNVNSNGVDLRWEYLKVPISIKNY